MEGWLKVDLENFQDEIAELANNFLEMEHLVDDTLAKFKSSGPDTLERLFADRELQS